MDLNEIKAAFKSPPNEYRGKPFWSWNGELRREEIVRQTHIMKEMGLGGYFMHSRSGLITEYLGEEWFALINAAADEAEKLGMEAWLYDEDRWPSGSCGGRVTTDPAYRMRSLVLTELPPEAYEPDTEHQTLAVFAALVDGIDLPAYERLADTGTGAVRERMKELSEAPAGRAGTWRVLTFTVVPDPCESNFNGTTYIDTMSEAATRRFIELTHEEYAKHCGDRLGRTIRGIFSDEPHRGHCMDDQRRDGERMTCSLCYTPDVFEQYEKRFGTDLLPRLPELFYRFRGEKVSPLKLHYIDLCDHLFCERFAGPIRDWCHAHGMQFTGHVLHEDSLMNQTVPHGSLMRFYEYMDVPGVDVLTEGNRNYWIVKQLSSAARQLGKKWMLSELYGCTGWQMDLRAHKAVGDWQALFGINVRCHHLSWYTMEGESKRDYPASILHQSPWYRDYRAVEDHFARLGLLMSEGEPACDVLVLNPIESLWCQAYAGWASWLNNRSPDVTPVEERYVRLFRALTERQIDFDYGEEEMLSRLASVGREENGGAVLRVGQASYHVAVVSGLLTIRPSTLALLREFADEGGVVIFAGEVPSYVDALPSGAPAALAARTVTVPSDGEALAEAIRSSSAFRADVSRSGRHEPGVFVQLRRGFGGGWAACVLNTDRGCGKQDLTLSLKLPDGLSVQEWDTGTGERFAFSDVRREDGDYLLGFSLEAGGTRCFVFLPAEETEALPCRPKENTFGEAVLRGEFAYSTDEENVCVLDHVRWRIDGGEWQEENEVLKADRALRTRLGLEWRGGSMLQPWFAGKNDTKVYGRVEAEYGFYVETLPTAPVFLAGERPGLLSYRVNGIPLRAGDADDFWIDDCFKKMPIPGGVLKRGRNVVSYETDFRRTTNTEAVYLVGRFGVRTEGHVCTLTSLPEKLPCGALAPAGLPFYTGCVTYHIPPDRYLPLLGEGAEKADRILLSPVSFTGALVRVEALGKKTRLCWEPYEADVTEAVRAGAPIDVTVVGTRRNLFGPLHQIPAIAGAYGPGNFVTEGDGWTDGYSLIGSGMEGIRFLLRKAGNEQ